jgi:hypothetical protein
MVNLIIGLEVAVGAALCAAGVLADRRLRSHGQAAVRAIPRPGPSASVTLYDAGTRPGVIGLGEP